MKITLEKFNEKLRKVYRDRILNRTNDWMTKAGAGFALGVGAVSIDTFRDLFAALKIMVEKTDESGKVLDWEIDIDKLKAGLDEMFIAQPDIVLSKDVEIPFLGIKKKVSLHFTKDDATALYEELAA